MKCPHCNKVINEPKLELAARNAENYGSGYFYFKCKKCGKRYSVYIKRTIEVGKTAKVSDNVGLSYG